VACASALLDRGLEVTLLDGGLALESDRRALVDDLAASAPGAWPAASLAKLRGSAPTLGGVQLKYAYGSDFPYRDAERLVPFENRGTATRPTLARGGFSSVWGAAVLPYRARDIADWPFGLAELEPHYRAACAMLAPSAVRDDLEEILPLYMDAPRPLRPSAQAEALLCDLEASAATLKADGIRFGRARLAVRAEDDARGPGCVYCGLCLHGCPYGLIYDASTTLAALRRRAGFRYVTDAVVERIEEAGGAVRLIGSTRTKGEPLYFEAARAYLACGVVSTTRLLLASLEAFDRPVEIRDSQYFLLPWIRARGAGAAHEDALHTLAQVFIELSDDAPAPSAHLQVYTYNDHYRALVERMLGPAAGLARRPTEALLSRLLLIQGYLHSSVSPSMRATLRQRGGRAVLEIEARTQPDSRRALRRVTRRLLRHARAFRAVPILPLLQVAPPGRGFHSGGSFPMRESPGPFECDRLGRPHGFTRVHVVDATAFPSIPATTITLSVMANAHRIGSMGDVD
jgi:choline dehydrogenase-like flavoprotein